MTDTQPMAPTDAEIWQMWMSMARRIGVADPVEFARAVLAKWGSQPVGAQPAPQQEAQYNHGPQAETVAEAARDVGKWLNERPNRPIDLRHVAMLSAHAQAAQEAQEPVAWYVTGGSRLLDEDEAKAEARHIGGTARAMPLYTAPQPSPASQGDALDAARLDWLDEDDGDHVSKVGKTWYTRPAYGRPYRKHKNLRAAIDAARKQGANHD